MRARLVRPEFWSDARVGKLPAHTRLTYIGLWNMADDAGFFRWDVEEIGAALYGFEAAAEREDAVVTDLAHLVVTERVHMLDCTVHGLIPTLREWRIQGGTVNERIRRDHETTCQVPPSTAKYRSVSLSESPYESVSPSPRLRRRDDGTYEVASDDRVH